MPDRPPTPDEILRDLPDPMGLFKQYITGPVDALRKIYEIGKFVGKMEEGYDLSMGIRAQVVGDIKGLRDYINRSTLRRLVDEWREIAEAIQEGKSNQEIDKRIRVFEEDIDDAFKQIQRRVEWRGD